MRYLRFISFAFCVASTVVSDAAPQKAVDMVAQKRTQYGRILYPPQENGFEPDRWIAKIESPGMKREEFADIERLLDVRSRLYATAERLRYRPERDPEGESIVAQAYDALNMMDVAAASNFCAQLESRISGSEAWMPYGGYSPFNWVKCFTQWGYMRAPDGCSVSEPNPWLVMWSDGFRLNLAPDARVAIANTAQQPEYYETRYLKPMTDVKFERSWVDTRWLLPDRRITFSLLTPVIDVDGIDTFVLSGLPSPPVRLRWTLPNGQIRSVQLTEAPPVQPEVIASALMDFGSPPVPECGKSCGTQKISPESVDRPYLRLVGRDWKLALFPGARPVSAFWSKGVFTMKMRRKSWVGVMRLPDNVSSAEHPEMCEFFAAASLAYPESCRSEASGCDMAWRYSHRMRTSEWDVSPRVTAPLPPILDCAGVHVPGARKVFYPTKWGVYRYCEGSVASCRISESPAPSAMRGVNVGIWDDDSKWESFATNGADWVRAFFNRNESLETQLARLENRLAKYGKRMRVLVDPHSRYYGIKWKSGMVPENDSHFVEMWGRIAKACAPYGDAVAGYDLYNEPGIIAGAEGRWRELCAKAARAIHSHHPGAMVFYPAIYGSNPNGLFNLEPLPPDCEPQSISYHFYSPHSFTHQKTSTRNRGQDTCVFYPAWAAPIDWKGGNHFGGTSVDWYDRWTLGAILLPAFEHYARYRRPMHVGEYGVVGYANRQSPYSAFMWTRDTTEIIESHGAGWHIWNQGFGLGNSHVREYVHGLWRRSQGAHPIVQKESK